MDAAKITNFGGMLPIADDTVLPQNIAAYAENTWIYSGVLDGLPQPTLVRACSALGTSKVYRIPKGFTDAQHMLYADWLEFPHPDTDIIRSLIADDTFERYYWASPLDAPRYNTRARIQTGDPAWKLGIPAPANAPGVSISGGADVVVSRAYVYTWVSTYGEEGPPSPPQVASGYTDGTWDLTLTASDPNDRGVDRTLAKTRIYRTITSSSGVATYFFVDEIDITTTTYADTNSDTVVSANSELPSTTWTAPPDDLQGWVTMPNGMMTGFRENEIWFCEPYRPHAWPAEYTLVVDYPVVGLGVYGQTLVVLTQGYPFLINGVHPSSMTQSRLTNYEPCTSRGSVLSSPEGVYYGSPNGLVLVADGTVKVVTRELIQKDRWQQFMHTATMRAGRLGTAYYAFGSARPGVFEPTAWDGDWVTPEDYAGSYSGILVDPATPRIGMSVVTNALPCANIMNDPWSGELLIIRNNSVYWVDVSSLTPTKETYVWRSKKFQLTSRKNLAACRVYFDVPVNTPALNPVPNTALEQELAADQWGLIRIFADDVLVFTRELRTSGELIRLPSGFKRDYWQIEFEARVKIKGIQIGSSVKALSKV